ncbi:MAG: hypothetical protein L6R41_001501 [Letrouitia leprolyta]|nr:MAG: hypothetical protein L6R41_001501 [Letrouitia leprolyta]
MQPKNTDATAPIAHSADTFDGMCGLDASKLIFTRNDDPKPLPNAHEIATMNAYAKLTYPRTEKPSLPTARPCYNRPYDHLHLECEGRLVDSSLGPYGPLTLMPIASVLHYATECFEGTKRYRGYDGLLRLFRPELNTIRMLASAQRISLPSFDPIQLPKLIEAMVSVDSEKWLPRSRPGTFLYLRPAMTGTEPTIGVSKPREALLYIIAL